jgi:hypothetical protein
VRDRQAVQRADRLACGQPLVGGCGIGQRPFRHERDHGVEPGVHPLDPVEVRLHQLAGGDLAAPQGFGHVAGGAVAEFGGHVRSPSVVEYPMKSVESPCPARKVCR